MIKPLSDRALTRLATELRVAHLNATQASDRFNARNAELTAKMDAQPNVYGNWMVRRTYLLQDVERKDHLDDYQYWKGEEHRMADMIQAERNLRDMNIAIIVGATDADLA